VTNNVSTESGILKDVYALWNLASPRRRVQFFILLILIFAAVFAELFSIGAVIPFLGVLSDPGRLFIMPSMQPAINMLSITREDQLLFPLTLIFCIAVLSAAGLRLLLLWATTRLSFAFGADISIDIYRNTLYQPYAVHCARNSSEIISGISTKSSTVIYGIVLPVLTFISSIILVVAIASFLILVNPMIALVTFAGFGLIYGVIVHFSRKKVSRDSKLISVESTRVIKALQEGLGGIRDVLIDGSQNVYCDIYRASDLPLRRAQGNNLFVAQSPRFLMEGLGMLLIAIVAYSSVKSSGAFSGAIPLLGGLALGAQRALPVLQAAYNAWATINGAAYSLKDILVLLRQPIPLGALDGNKEPLIFEEQLQVKDLGFRYSPDLPYVFQNLNIEIPKGSRVGFKGTTGRGKSTLLDILMGLLSPDEGFIQVDNTPITSSNLRDWQAHIAHVPQEIFLADCSIAENIAFGTPKHLIDTSRVVECAKRAQVWDVIDALPLRLNTNVGEQGVLLSGGQRQRIGIARALYKNASIIIFDEATSALDNETENKVMDAIHDLGKDITLLIIAHRLSTLKNCSLVIDLDQL
jgi:ATP-binding cassette, subfamily B, bacterial PglK